MMATRTMYQQPPSNVSPRPITLVSSPGKQVVNPENPLYIGQPMSLEYPEGEIVAHSQLPVKGGQMELENGSEVVAKSTLARPVRARIPVMAQPLQPILPPVKLEQTIMTGGKVCPLFTNQSFVDEYGDLIQPPIGKGAFGSVYMTQKNFIAKMFAVGQEVPADFIREVTIISALNQRKVSYVTPFRRAGVFYIKDTENPFNRPPLGYYPWMVVEKGDGNIIQLYKQPFEVRYQVCNKIAVGLREVHQNNIVHRDIKPANILFKNINGVIIPWINDFGISAFNTCVSTLSSGAGTLIFMAPEMFQSPYTYSFGVDVWAYGLVLLSMMAGVDAFEAWIVFNNLQSIYTKADKAAYRLLIDQFRNYLLDSNKTNALIDAMNIQMPPGYDILMFKQLIFNIFRPANTRFTMEQVEAFSFFKNNLGIPKPQLPCYFKMFRNIYVPADAGIVDHKRLDYLTSIISIINFSVQYLAYLAGSIGLMDSVRISNDLTTLDIITIVRIMVMNYDGGGINLQEVNRHIQQLGQNQTVSSKDINDNTVRLAGCAKYQLYYTSVLEYVHAKTKESDFAIIYPYIKDDNDVMTLLALTMVLIFDPIQCRGLDDDETINTFILTTNNIIGVIKYGQKFQTDVARTYTKFYQLYLRYRKRMSSNLTLISYLDALFTGKRNI